MKNEIEYNGTWFYEGTDEKVMNAICSNLHKNRVRFWYGKDGKSWNEENDIIGYIGRTTGKHFPILVHNSRSLGGGIILTDRVVKMQDVKTGRVLYQHPMFSQSVFTANNNEVLQDGSVYARCNNEKQAQRLSDFMNGKRHSK